MCNTQNTGQPQLQHGCFPKKEQDDQKVTVCTVSGCAPVPVILRHLHMMCKSSRGNCYRNTCAHHFSSAILQHLCDTYRSHHSGQAKLQLVSKQFSIERERRAGTALTFSFPLAAYQILGDWRSGNLDPTVRGFTGGAGLGFRAQPLGIMRKSHCRHVP